MFDILHVFHTLGSAVKAELLVPVLPHPSLVPANSTQKYPVIDSNEFNSSITMALAAVSSLRCRMRLNANTTVSFWPRSRHMGCLKVTSKVDRACPQKGNKQFSIRGTEVGETLRKTQCSALVPKLDKLLAQVKFQLRKVVVQC